MSKSKIPGETVSLPLAAKEVAKMLGVSVRHDLNPLAKGRPRRRTRSGRAVCWNADELRAWLAAGAPDAEAWWKWPND